MSMLTYLILFLLALGLPLLYWGALQWYKSDFDEEKNQNRKPLRSIPEIIAMVVSEIALIKIWYDYSNGSISGVIFALLYTVLVVMTTLCITDYWEKVVPNKILIMLILIGVIVIGIQGVLDMNVVIGMFPSMVLGLVFCAIAFGLTYIVSRGSMGSGDVKLAILLGIFLTAEYVVGTIFYGCLASALFSIVQMARKKLTRKDVLPFVPFLYIGLIITYLVG